MRRNWLLLWLLVALILTPVSADNDDDDVDDDDNNEEGDDDDINKGSGAGWGAKMSGGRIDPKAVLQFENIDVNKDKRLSHEEVLKAFKTIRPSDSYLDSKVKAFFAKRDRNKDGFISRVENSGMMKFLQAPPEPWVSIPGYLLVTPTGIQLLDRFSFSWQMVGLISIAFVAETVWNKYKAKDDEDDDEEDDKED